MMAPTASPSASARPTPSPRSRTSATTGRCIETLTNQVVPLYYDRDASGLPRGWIARQKNAFRTLAWRFNADRMVMDYVQHSYLPAAGGLSCAMPRSERRASSSAPSPSARVRPAVAAVGSRPTSRDRDRAVEPGHRGCGMRP